MNSVLQREELEQSPLADLHALASELGIEGYRRLRREELIQAILGGGGALSPAQTEAPSGDAPADEGERPARRRRGRGGRGRRPAGDGAAVDEGEDSPKEDESGPEEPRTGVLDILTGGSGFLRADPFSHSADDAYVSPAQVRRCELRTGDELAGPVRPARRSERHPSLVRVENVNGAPAEPPEQRPHFAELTAVFPTERLAGPPELVGQPFGKGSRVAIGGPPGAGTSRLLREVARTLVGAELQVVVVLAGVRPEEVTEWSRELEGVHVAGGGFDLSPDLAAQAAELAVERAKRAAERGADTVVVIDSLEFLPAPVQRRVFAAARKAEEGGSVTVVAGTGVAWEPQRQATTRVMLDPPKDGTTVVSESRSGVLRGELLA